MQKQRIKSLEEILRENPDYQAYIHDLNASIAAKWAQNPPPPDCPTCGGMGVVRRDLPTHDPNFGKLFPCPDPDCPVVHRQRETRYAKLSTSAQIPKGYEDLTFERWDELFNDAPDYLQGKLDALGAALAFVAARERDYQFTLDDAAAILTLPPPEYQSNHKNSIVFSGANGMGKTSLAVSIAHALLEEHCGVVYIRLTELFDGLKDRFEDKPTFRFMPQAGSDAELMGLVAESPVLIIDEFPPDVTDWRKERAEQLVNYRYTHQLPTIITTNLDSDTLIAKWGLTTGHRIMAMSHWIMLEGHELRRRAPMRVSR